MTECPRCSHEENEDFFNREPDRRTECGAFEDANDYIHVCKCTDAFHKLIIK